MKKQFKLELSIDRCKGCELCAAVCPRGILAIDKETMNQGGYHPIGVKAQEDCIGCAFCASMCPDGVISIYEVE